MKHEIRTQLDEMMVAYDRTIERAHDSPGEAERVRQNFNALCREIIRPAMQAYSEVLEAHGHGVRIYGHDMSVDDGGHSRGAELMMHVVPRDRMAAGGDAPGAFVMTFSMDTANHRVLARVTNPADGACGYSNPYDVHPVDGVTAELVENELLEMIRYGFACAGHSLAVEERRTVNL